MLLPPLTATGWTAVHHFEPACSISGDFVDVVPFGDRLYFMRGDASGKGAAASLVMAQLHAMFRTLIPFQLSLDALMMRASGLLCANSLPAQYAMMVSGYLAADGEVVIANADHPPPVAIAGTRHTDVRGDRRADGDVLRVAVLGETPDIRPWRHSARIQRRPDGSAEPLGRGVRRRISAPLRRRRSIIR